MECPALCGDMAVTRTAPAQASVTVQPSGGKSPSPQRVMNPERQSPEGDCPREGFLEEEIIG